MQIPPPFPFASGLTLLDAAKVVIEGELKLDVLRHVLKQAIDFGGSDAAQMRLFAQELLRHGCSIIISDQLMHDEKEFRAQVRAILHSVAMLLVLEHSKVFTCPHHGVPLASAPHQQPPSAN